MRNLISLLMLFAVTAACANTAPPSTSNKRIEPYIYVQGGVRAPGRYDWKNGMTVLDAIQAAGGFTNPAEQQLIKIIHADGTMALYRHRDIAHQSYAYQPVADDAKKPPLARAGDT